MVGIMGNCKDCKHWEKNDASYQAGGRGWGQCRMGLCYDGVQEVADTLAFASDSEAFAAVLATAPNFGCVQFEIAE